VAKLISNYTLTDLIPHQTLPNKRYPTIMLEQYRVKIVFISLSSFNNIQLFIISESLFSTLSACKNNKFVWRLYITNILLTISHVSC